jgi:hypothetical protein
MEIWLKWGETSVFFDAPDELELAPAKPSPEAPDHYQNLVAQALSNLSEPVVIIDYLPPARAYADILPILSGRASDIHASLWRIPPDQRRGALGELGLTALGEARSLGSEVLLLCHNTTRQLIGDTLDWPRGYLELLLKMEGAEATVPPEARITVLELGYDSQGTPIATANLANAADSVVVSAGGAPYDSTLYTSLQALIIASRACSEDGSLLLAAECAQGIGSPLLAKALYEAQKGMAAGEHASPEQILARRYLEVARRLRVILATSLPRALSQGLLGARGFDTVQEGFTHLLRIHSRSHRSALIEEGVHTYVAPAAVA